MDGAVQSAAIERTTVVWRGDRTALDQVRCRGLSLAHCTSSLHHCMRTFTSVDNLSGVRACRVSQVYRGPEGERADQGRAQRHAAVISAYHVSLGRDADPLVVGWQRNAAAPSIDVFAAGAVVGPANGDGGVSLSVPSRGRGWLLDNGHLVQALRGVRHWTRVAGLSDGLLVSDVAVIRAVDARPTLDDCLLRVWREPFAWFVLAEPVAPAEVAEEAVSVAALEREAKTRSSPEYVVKGIRLEARHRDLRRAESSGWWRIHLLAGADSPQAAVTVSALLAARGVASMNWIDQPRS
jgi:uncharacterized protein